MKTLYIIVIAVMQAVIAIIPFLGKIADNRFSFPKRITKYGRFLIASCLITIVCTFLLFNLSESEATKAQQDLNDSLKARDILLLQRTYEYNKELNRKLADRDSLHEFQDSILTATYGERVDSSYSKSIKASNEALAKYNLILIDSMKKVEKNINIKSRIDPIISILPSSPLGGPIYYSIENGDPIIKMQYQVFYSPANNIDLRYRVYTVLNKDGVMGLIIPLDSGFIEKRKFMITDVTYTKVFKIKKEWLILDNLIFYLEGSFSNDKENKIIQYYDQAFNFNLITKTGGVIDGGVVNSIKRLLRKNH